MNKELFERVIVCIRAFLRPLTLFRLPTAVGTCIHAQTIDLYKTNNRLCYTSSLQPSSYRSHKFPSQPVRSHLDFSHLTVLTSPTIEVESGPLYPPHPATLFIFSLRWHLADFLIASTPHHTSSSTPDPSFQPPYSSCNTPAQPRSILELYNDI